MSARTLLLRQERAIPRLRVDWLSGMFVAITVAVLMWLSLGRYNAYHALMFDLGNMAQPIWSVTQGRPLEVTSESGNISRLSVHVEVIYFAFAPLYAMWPDPRTLLVAQALLFAAGSIPAFRLGRRHTGSVWGGRAIAFAYLVAPAAQSAVLFDFHGDTLAMPLLLFAIDALEGRRWRAYAVWVGLALLCKFYVAVPVAVLGLILLADRSTRRAGLLTFLGAGAYFVFAFVGLRRLFAPEEVHASVGTVEGYARFYFSWQRGLEHIPTRVFTAAILLQPLLGLPWRVAWRFLPALAVSLPALLGVGSITYSIRTHHFALAVPFLIWTMAAGAGALLKRRHGARLVRFWSALALALMTAFSLALMNVELTQIQESGPPTDWTLHSERDRLRDRWLEEHIPPQVPVAGPQPLLTHLTNRPYLYTLLPPHSRQPLAQLERNLEQVEYVIADAYTSDDHAAIALMLGQDRFGLVQQDDGLLLFRKAPHSGEALEQSWEVLPGGAEDEALFTFNDMLALRQVDIDQVGERRFRAEYEWVALSSLPASRPRESALLVVTELVGVPHARYVHLTLFPALTEGWPAGTVVRESWEFEAPDELAPGAYDVRVALQERFMPLAIEKSRFLDEHTIGSVQVGERAASQAQPPSVARPPVLEQAAPVRGR